MIVSKEEYVKDIIENLGIKYEYNIEDVNKVLDIVQIGDERLRKKNKNIDDIKKVYDLIINMANTLYYSNGCGLAAPQIGENINLFIVEIVSLDENDEEYVSYPLTVFANPKIIEYSKEKDEDYEGCLSVGDFYAVVKRSKKIKIEYTDIFGNRVIEEVEGFPARAIQHEYDHLRGIIYTDIADIKTLTTRENLVDNKKERA